MAFEMLQVVLVTAGHIGDGASGTVKVLVGACAPSDRAP
jgi:hypothetical protein